MFDIRHNIINVYLQYKKHILMYEKRTQLIPKQAKKNFFMSLATRYKNVRFMIFPLICLANQFNMHNCTWYLFYDQ